MDPRLVLSFVGLCLDRLDVVIIHPSAGGRPCFYQYDERERVCNGRKVNIGRSFVISIPMWKPRAVEGLRPL